MNRFIWLGLTVVVIALTWVGLWYYGSAQIRQNFEDARQNALREGTILDCDSLTITGLPFRYDVFCSNLSISANDVTLTLPELSATIRIYAPTHALMFAKGPLNIDDAFTGSRRKLTWDNFTLSARTNGFALARVSATGENFILHDTIIDDFVLGEIGQLEVHLMDAPETYNAAEKTSSWALFARTNQSAWSQLGIGDAQFRLEANFPTMPDDLRTLDLATLARNWADPNPKIDLHVLEGQDPSSSFSIMGNIGLDADATWNGDFDVTTQGLDTRLGGMTSAPMLSIFLGDPTPDGKLYRAYSLRHGVLFAGNIPISAVPPLL